MTARDRYPLPIECTACEITGTATISETGGYAYMSGHINERVDAVTAGFSIQKPKPGLFQVVCERCGAIVSTAGGAG